MSGKRTFDVIVVGLGVMGSAAALALAKRGLRVLGLDRYEPPHRFGSSHGETRAIREAYFEDPSYVPIVQESYARWGEIAEAAGERLFLRTGALMIGPKDGVIVPGAHASARQHGLEHQLLDGAALRERYPSLRPVGHELGLLEPNGGILRAEPAVESLLLLATQSGAELQVGESCVGWRSTTGAIRVETDRAAYAAGSLVLAAGPWMSDLVPAAGLRVERVLQHWFRPSSSAAAVALGADRLPIFVWEYEPQRYWYAFPQLDAAVAGPGVKAALHYEGSEGDPDALDRSVSEAEIAEMRVLLERYLPDAAGEHLRSAVCLYTNTRDMHFLVDRHPDEERVVVVSPCSGHGFKFAPVIGEIAADLVAGAAPRHDLSLFRWRD